ncbi:MAG: Zinc ABC transporter, periplasmic-binding protein ZnuA [uncultured Thiotrichaceae bacterium]|uniref:Zinc ABC transporter, periplasmic-binding protein ZnuA n=1 Tax=uncultured Thiotrichaceae bacterium TaxID=298394 RepID=A0A6S6U850_9GAMM|nr:MAG: Zinc ABC transporter, periplasmic-binding protein ZnuA [uncultured Thiotrichaceae bacterium]
MKKLLLLSVLFLVPAVQADMRILACEPEWGALAKEIGGAKVKVHNATTAKQDPHHIEARPSLIAKARRADMLLCTGAELETGWLPLLLQKSSNSKIQPGKPGHFMATDHVKMLEVLGKVDRSMGDVHGDGNPHIQTDPRRILQVADALVGKMKIVDAANASHYQQGYQSFKQRWQQAMQKWNQQAQVLRGMPIVVHHRSWVYLQDWLGLKEVAALEPKPGIPPSTGHLVGLLKTLKQTPAKVIIYSAYQNPRSANWLASKAGIGAVQLPSTVGGTPAAKDLFGLFDDIVQRLVKAKG